MLILWSARAAVSNRKQGKKENKEGDNKKTGALRALTGL